MQEVSGWISGMHHLLEWQTKTTAAYASVKFAEAAFRGDKLSKRLLDAGFTEKNWGRIQEQIKKHAKYIVDDIDQAGYTYRNLVESIKLMGKPETV